MRLSKIQFGVDATSMLKKTYGKGVFDEETVVINEKSKANEKVIEMVGFEKVALQQRYDLFVSCIFYDQIFLCQIQVVK